MVPSTEVQRRNGNLVLIEVDQIDLKLTTWDQAGSRADALALTTEPPTIGDLCRNAIIKNEEIAEAVEAFLADPKLKAFQFASGHVLDVSAAVKGHRPAKAVLGGKITSDAFRRSVVRAAVIRATVTDEQ